MVRRIELGRFDLGLSLVACVADGIVRGDVRRLQWVRGGVSDLVQLLGGDEIGCAEEAREGRRVSLADRLAVPAGAL